MSNNWKKTTRILAAFALLGAIIACGGDEDDGDNTGATSATGATTEGTAAAQPAAGGAPATLVLGAAPVALAVPIPPSFNLTVATAAEYQIDASGSPRNPVMFVYQGDQLIEQDSSGGEGSNARIVRFLAPGNYSVRLNENRARDFTSQVQAQQLEPLAPVGVVTPGTPLQVQIPDFPIMSRPRNDRASARSATFTVAAAGQYTCVASTTTERRDPKMAIIQNGIVLDDDDDSGEGNNASITRQFAAGTYIIRVWDWVHRGDMTIDINCNPG